RRCAASARCRTLSLERHGQQEIHRKRLVGVDQVHRNAKWAQLVEGLETENALVWLRLLPAPGKVACRFSQPASARPCRKVCRAWTRGRPCECKNARSSGAKPIGQTP